MKQQIVKLAIGLLVLILFSITCVAIFYPDFRTNEYNYYFMATAQLELCDKHEKNMDSVEDIFIKESMDATIREIDIHIISTALKNIDYDTKVNFKEASRSLSFETDGRTLKITVTSHDNEYAGKMANEIVNQLVTDAHWGAPNFYFDIIMPVKMERHLTPKAFFDRQLGEEITVAFFTIVWICVLGIILMMEIKKGKVKNAANKE